MKTVGIRELKNRLSEYIRQVKRGEELLVTDRGEVVAEIRPPTNGRISAGTLSDLARQGKLRIGAPNDPSLYRPLKRLASHADVWQLLEEERGER